jgi:hypothetical protein
LAALAERLTVARSQLLRRPTHIGAVPNSLH